MGGEVNVGSWGKLLCWDWASKRGNVKCGRFLFCLLVMFEEGKVFEVWIDLLLNLWDLFMDIFEMLLG